MNRIIWRSWTVRRVAYLILGIWVVIQSIMDKQWMFLGFGMWFIIMAVLKLGCAGGQCGVDYSKYKKEDKNVSKI